MAYIIGQYGIASLGSYAKLIGACYLGAALFILVLAAIAVMAFAIPAFADAAPKG